MLRSVEVVGYLSYDNTKFSFHPRFNVIKGDSDSGKSVLFRNINWTLMNRPTDWGSFKRWEALKTASKMTFEDGVVVERTRTAKDNSYTIPDHEPFKSVGKQVPELVTQLVDLDERNIQSQHDAYFMLQTPSPVRAKLFNKAAGIEVIDDLTATLERMINDTRSELRVRKNDLETKQTELKSYDYLDPLSGVVSTIESLLESQQRDTQLVSEVKKLVEDIDREICIINTFDAYLPKATKLYNKVVLKMKELEETKKEEQKVREIVSGIVSAKMEIKRLEQHLSRKHTVKVVDSNLRQLLDEKQKFQLLRDLTLNIIREKDQYHKIVVRLTDIKNKRDEVMQGFNACPLCGTILKGGKYEGGNHIRLAHKG